MFLLNGEVKQQIEFSDRGFQYGDGLFETIEIVNGTPVFFDLHLQRLNKGCERLLIPEPNISQLKKEAVQISELSPHAVLKLMVTRGSGGRGYRLPDSSQPTRLLSLHAFPQYPDSYFSKGISIRFCDNRLGLNVSLAGIKHMNRLEQIIARAEWNSADIQEGIMLDSDGNVVEGTMSNLFLIRGNILYTPVIDQCGVEGIIRNIIIFLAKENGVTVVEKKITKEEVYQADEIFMTNSVIGIWPVKQLEKQVYQSGTITKELVNHFFEYKQRELAHDN